MQRALWAMVTLVLLSACGEGDKGDSSEPGTALTADQVSCVTIEQRDDLRAGEPTAGSIAVAFAVYSCDGVGVVDLTSEDFHLTENGTTISATEAQVSILNRDAEAFVTLVLDNSPSVASSGALDAAVDAALGFVDKLFADGEGTTFVRVAFFSQSFEVKLDFTSDQLAVRAAVESLRNDTSGANTTNLYGAVIEALQGSDQAQAARRAAMRDGVLLLGQVVVFTDGSDQAALYTLNDALSQVSSSSADVITLAFGGEVDPDVLKQLGPDGSYVSGSASGLSYVFEQAADRLISRKAAQYVLAYCTPKLAGTHQLVLALEDKGASVPITFSAEGFNVTDDKCSVAALANACDGKHCGGLWCGGCSPTASCATDDTCACDDWRFLGPDCVDCLPSFTGPTCEECADPHFSAPSCTSCLSRFTGPNCDECTYPAFTGDNCDECADPKFTGKYCQECTDPKFTGPDCDECADPKFAGQDCDQCANPKVTGALCDACVEPTRFTGEDCGQCVDPKFTGPDCDECTYPAFTGPDCDECVNPKFKGEFCDECAEPEVWTGEKCDECVDPKFVGEGCSECANPDLTGPECDQCSEKVCGELSIPGMGTFQCGACGDGLYCEENQCQDPCSEQVCGDVSVEGMGTFQCGTCPQGQHCAADGAECVQGTGGNVSVWAPELEANVYWAIYSYTTWAIVPDSSGNAEHYGPTASPVPFELPIGQYDLYATGAPAMALELTVCGQEPQAYEWSGDGYSSFQVSCSFDAGDTEPSFCEKYATTCGDWSADTECETWWAAAAPGADGDFSGATQACYSYHLDVAMAAAGDPFSVAAHCAHAVGAADADGNAPCTDAEPAGPCQDDALWADKDGDGCNAYNQNPSWCNFAADYANANGVSALQACCVCKD